MFTYRFYKFSTLESLDQTTLTFERSVQGCQLHVIHVSLVHICGGLSIFKYMAYYYDCCPIVLGSQSQYVTGMGQLACTVHSTLQSTLWLSDHWFPAKLFGAQQSLSPFVWCQCSFRSA